MEKAQCSSRKVERKVVEKNRRNHMKALQCELNSLLPHHNSKEMLPVADQIDEAVKYIKILETNLKKCKEKKEGLEGRKRSYACLSSECSKSPKIEIHQTGSLLQVTLTTGLDHQSMFAEVLRILQQEGAEVVNANYSVVEDTVFHIFHTEISDSIFCTGAARITERLNKFVYGCADEDCLQPELLDFEIHPEMWDF